MADIKKIGGANMDIDLASQDKVTWKQQKCPWGEIDGNIHQCATKNTSICDYFCGIESWDTVLCSYPNKVDHKKLR